ncbi:MAG: TspB protein [Inoviridae sp.]|nr:MAG: TspB protein [Inoviridae sp.]
MGLFNIFRVCSSLFLVAALGSAQANYIYDNRTGTWTPTARTVLAPPNASSPFNYIPRDSPPTVSSTGAFQNKTGGTFGSPPVNGSSRNVPVTINGTTTKPNVNKALLSRLGRGGLAGIALGAGIDALLNGIGALIDGGGNVSRIDGPVDISHDTPSSYDRRSTPYSYGYYYRGDSDSAALYAAAKSKPNQIFVDEMPHPVPSSFYPLVVTCSIVENAHLIAYANNYCYYDSGDQPPPQPALVPFPLPDLEDAINSGYQPHPSDYPFLAPDPAMIPTIVEVEPISRLDFPPVTTTTTDLDTGKTTTVTTNIWHDFNVKDNNSPQPKIDAETTTKSDTYVDGEKTGESTSTSSSGTATGVGPVAGSGSGEKLEIDIPTDCDFMPTVCAFLEWYKDDDLGDDPDLASIMKDDEEFAKTKVISFGAAVCPQPYTIHISSLSMSVDLSFEFFCQFAEYARALVLAAAYIFAAYISLGVARG